MTTTFDQVLPAERFKAYRPEGGLTSVAYCKQNAFEALVEFGFNGRSIWKQFSPDTVVEVCDYQPHMNENYQQYRN